MKTFTIDLNPKILAWARSESGVTVSEIAEHLKVESSLYKQWETDGKGVKYTDIKRIAKYYKRQVPVFFLREVPKKTPKPKDFRSLTLDSSRGMHRDTMVAIRRTAKYLELYREYSDKQELAKSYQWLSNIRGNDYSVFGQLREYMNVTISDQLDSHENNFTFWREKFEKYLNIFVFQFPIESNEFDGFSYLETGKPYAITLNSHISDNRKVFTLFHELSHIIEGESGICYTNAANISSRNVETRCNQFAAEFLMPAEQVIPPGSYEELKRNARSFGVSAEAFLIRCKELGLIKPDHYRELYALVQKANGNYKKRKSSGGPSQVLVSKSQRGEKFFDFVLRAYDSRKISSTIVRDTLSIKVASLGRQDT